MLRYGIILIQIVSILLTIAGCQPKIPTYTKFIVEIPDSACTSVEADEIIKVIEKRFQIGKIPDYKIQTISRKRFQVVISREFVGDLTRSFIENRGFLEIRKVANKDLTLTIMKKIDSTLATRNTDKTTIKDSLIESNFEHKMTEELFNKLHPFFSVVFLDESGSTMNAYVEEKHLKKVKQIFNEPDIIRLIPDGVEFLFSSTGLLIETDNRIRSLYLLYKVAELNAEDITNDVILETDTTHKYNLAIKTTSDGKDKFSKLTEESLGKPIALVLDSEVNNISSISSRIDNGLIYVSILEDFEAAMILEVIIKSGRLKYAPKIVREEKL
jgi:hypothetical protein